VLFEPVLREDRTPGNYEEFSVVQPDCLTIGALLDALPGDRYQSVRDPPKSLRLRLPRMLYRQAHPDAVEGVRGVGVAGDNLLYALLKYSTAACFTLFMEPGPRVGDKGHEVLRERGLNRQGVSLTSRAALLNGGMGSAHPDAWLDIYGTAIEAFSLRNHFASRLYPITTLHSMPLARTMCCLNGSSG